MITPQEKQPRLATAMGIKELYFKREDLHPYGSHKGRSIPPMIDRYLDAGDKRFAISSSGNAALAAAMYTNELNRKYQENINLQIFIGNHIKDSKLAKLKALEDKNITIFKKERPLQALLQASEEGIRSLRQSNDDTALLGYESLAQELSEIKDLAAIFLGASSGTTAQALAQYFSGKNVEIHIVQTSSCHPLADAFDSFSIPQEKSLADAIIDQTAHRKNTLIPLIKKTGGKGWLATNSDIETALELVAKHSNIKISQNSALSVVGAMQATYSGQEMTGTIVCLICGD